MAWPVPRGRPVGSHTLPPSGLPVLRRVSLYRHAAAITPVGSLGHIAQLIQRQRPSPSLWRVGSHIVRFEACSAFTHVAACLLAEPPKAALYIEGSGSFVTSTAAPIATGWSEICRVGLAPTENSRLFTAHKGEILVFDVIQNVPRMSPLCARHLAHGHRHRSLAPAAPG